MKNKALTYLHVLGAITILAVVSMAVLFNTYIMTPEQAINQERKSHYEDMREQRDALRAENQDLRRELKEVIEKMEPYYEQYGR